ncbi:MAG: mandelate racemase/muconate lactonizing enzyme family protein [Pseudomonadota bacterium]
MKITRIAIHQVDLPLVEGSYSWADQSYPAFDSTVVLMDTDEGITGAGETCPLGSTYLAAYPDGARTGIAHLARDLIGLDPRATDAIADRMDRSLKGHPYAKSALDAACWDIAGKAAGMPVYALLGGARQERVRLFKVVTRQDPGLMAERTTEYLAAGFTNLQVKVGEDPDTDIERFHRVAAAMSPGTVMDADANCGWRQHDALRIAGAIDGLAEEHRIRVYLEQPCPSYEECLVVRRATRHPFILDECMDGLPALLRGWQDGAMDLINLKINRFGGLTRARLIRDLCVQLGISMTIEDSWGGEIATAAIAHLAQSTPAAFHFQSSAFHQYHTIAIADGAPEVEGGWMRASDRPGLGVEPDLDRLGPPVAVIED